LTTTRSAVDSGSRRPYLRRLLDSTIAVTAPLLLACASAGGPAPGSVAAPVDPAAAAAAERATALDATLHIVFDWSFTERDARFSGRGVTRFAPPERARLDLFGPRDETVLSAALVDMDLRLPPAAGAVPLPPASLMWSLLGMFRPPAGADLTASRTTGTTTELTYQRGGERWTFRIEGDALRSAEWVGAGQSRRTVDLEGEGSHGLPRQAVYRDHREFRELRVNLSEATVVDGFPADIWTVGG
jgi:hypothetical protein